MKIGLICPYNIFKGGGVQECVLALQAGLEKRGHTACIITPTPRDHTGPVPKNIILVGTSTDFKSPFHTTAQVSVSVKTEILQKVLDDQQFDILHFHEPWVPILSRQILTRSKAKNIATFHAKLPDSIMSRTIERVITPYTRSILKYLDSLTAVSSAATEYVRSLTNHTVHIIPNGIDLTHYSPSKLSSKTPNILYVGRLEKRKGVKHLLVAYQHLWQRYPEVELIIAGAGPDREKLEAYARDNKLTKVRFLGYITDRQKLELFKQAWVFCSPALYGESFGIVLLEAMACGVPVVAGNNPGYAAVLTGVGNHGLVNPKHGYDFANTLASLMFDKDLRVRWQNWAEKEIKQYAYERVVQQYESIYKQVMHHHENRIST